MSLLKRYDDFYGVNKRYPTVAEFETLILQAQDKDFTEGVWDIMCRHLKPLNPDEPESRGVIFAGKELETLLSEVVEYHLMNNKVIFGGGDKKWLKDKKKEKKEIVQQPKSQPASPTVAPTSTVSKKKGWIQKLFRR